MSGACICYFFFLFISMFRYVKNESTRCRSTNHFQRHTYIKEISYKPPLIHMLSKCVSMWVCVLCIIRSPCTDVQFVLYVQIECVCVLSVYWELALHNVYIKPKLYILYFVCICIYTMCIYLIIVVIIIILCAILWRKFRLRIFVFAFEYSCMCACFSFYSALFVRPVTAKHMCSIDRYAIFNDTLSWFFFHRRSSYFILLLFLHLFVSVKVTEQKSIRFQVCDKVDRQSVWVSKRAGKKCYIREYENGWAE